MLTVCCSCNRVKEQEAWVVNYRDETGDPVSHGYCPDCYGEIMDELSVVFGRDSGGRSTALQSHVLSPVVLTGFTCISHDSGCCKTRNAYS